MYDCNHIVIVSARDPVYLDDNDFMVTGNLWNLNINLFKTT